MKRLVYILLLLVTFFLVAFETVSNSDEYESFKLSTSIRSYIAGNEIQLTFSSSLKESNPQLFIVHSYGKTLLDGKKEEERYVFKIPSDYSKKTGVISWFLISKNKIREDGKIEVLPNQNTETYMENYLGPRSILAGNKEYTMLVAVPTDGYDNPLKDNTLVTLKHQFLQNEVVRTLKTEHFIAWRNIYSPYRSGKLLVSTECNKTATKEIETEVYPNIATNFSIKYSRNHEYADGNQITHIKTSIIRDQYGNIVSDGTLVTFIITTKNNLLLKTFGTTIKGIAKGEILHPDHEEVYRVKGFITGIAESYNSLAIRYKPIIDDFKYAFFDKNRTLKIGPIKSFMDQLIPNGIKVVVKVFHGNKQIATLQEDTYNGYAKFRLQEDFYTAKAYRFKVTTLGITKETETIHYD